MSDDDPAVRDLIRELALANLQHEQNVDAGLVSPAEHKAYEARVAERVAQLDEIRGTSDVTYADFRAAFDRGADSSSAAFTDM